MLFRYLFNPDIGFKMRKKLDPFKPFTKAALKDRENQHCTKAALVKGLNGPI
jgi:hypothetical protein